MGTVIDAVGSAEGGWRTRHSALRLAVKSAEDCLRHAGRNAHEVELLINAGIYRDRNLAEPALAALIQQDIGANPEEPHGNGHGTFSFDVSNGACGLLTALQIVDGFLKSHVIRCAMVVASDADPGHGMSENFPFASAGASLLCTWSDDDRGLGRIFWQNLPEQRRFILRHSWAGRSPKHSALPRITISRSAIRRCCITGRRPLPSRIIPHDRRCRRDCGNADQTAVPRRTRRRTGCAAGTNHHRRRRTNAHGRLGVRVQQGRHGHWRTWPGSHRRRRCWSDRRRRPLSALKSRKSDARAGDWPSREIVREAMRRSHLPHQHPKAGVMPAEMRYHMRYHDYDDHVDPGSLRM